MNHTVVVLNLDGSVINLCDWKRAYGLITKGKADVVENSDKEIRNTSGSYTFILPAVIKLREFIRSVYNAKVSFSKSNVIIRDHKKCVYCSSSEDLTVDHVLPVSKGGKSTWMNCVCSCKSCNWKKGDKLLENSGMVLKKKPSHPSLVQFYQAKIELFGMNSLMKKYLV